MPRNLRHFLFSIIITHFQKKILTLVKTLQKEKTSFEGKIFICEILKKNYSRKI